MALTTEQLALLNNIMYATDPRIHGNGQGSYTGSTLGEFVQDLDPAGCADTVMNTSTAAEWRNMIKAIQNDPTLRDLKIVDTHRDASNGDAHALFVDPKTNEAIVAFEGTGHGEWKDNFIAGTTMNNNGGDPTISPQQDKAIDYINSLKEKGYDHLTVTGHSKGGNKAKIAALMCDNVDNCVSFDGQGFSDEFFAAHQAEIAANQHKIHNHNLDSDFVNLLLNDVGDTTFYQGQRVGENFAKNHSTTSFLTDDCHMVEGKRSKDMAELDKYLNSMLRGAGKDKAAALNFAGDIADIAFGSRYKDSEKGDAIMKVLLDPKNTEAVSYVFAYTLKYERETGKITGTVGNILNRMGIPFSDGITGAVNFLLTNNMAYGAIKGLLNGAGYVPDWVFSLVTTMFNLPLTKEQLKQLFLLVAMTGEKLDTIHIDKNSGADLIVETPPPEPPEGQGTDQGFIPPDMSNTVIFVQFAEMISVCEALAKAVEYYNSACDRVKNAAERVAAGWEGDAKEAFVASQQEACTWYDTISQVALAASRCVRDAQGIYKEAEERLVGIMRG